MNEKDMYNNYYKAAYINGSVVPIDSIRTLTEYFKRTMTDLEICAIINVRITHSATNGENKTYVPLNKFKSDADIRRAITIYSNERYAVEKLSGELCISW